jgi:hypothetical protein
VAPGISNGGAKYLAYRRLSTAREDGGSIAAAASLAGGSKAAIEKSMASRKYHRYNGMASQRSIIPLIYLNMAIRLA